MSTTNRSDLAPPRVDKRVARSRAAVLSSAFELLYESGLGRFSVDEVVRRSGVAKTTIYRHWPTREALVLDACSRMETEEEAPDAGSLERDLQIVVARIAGLLSTAAWSSVLPSIVDAAERDPAFAEVHVRLQRSHAAPVRTVLERGRERGELPEDADVEARGAAVMGTLYYRRWYARQPLDEAFVASVVALALAR